MQIDDGDLFFATAVDTEFKKDDFKTQKTDSDIVVQTSTLSRHNISSLKQIL